MATRPARGCVWNAAAAAEHERPAAEEHRTTIASANMDWKRARHTGTRWRAHCGQWQLTTSEIIRGFDPAIICFCEVGEAHAPLHAEHFSTLQELTCLAWSSWGVSAEQVRFLRTEGQPYLTAFRVDRVACSGHCILSSLYRARGLERTAQHFLATLVAADTKLIGGDFNTGELTHARANDE